MYGSSARNDSIVCVYVIFFSEKVKRNQLPYSLKNKYGLLQHLSSNLWGRKIVKNVLLDF